MGKGEQTRERIVRESAALFNKHGYAGVSMSEIIESTGIQKGGIYRHFAGKDEIALEAYDYAAAVVRDKFRESLEGKTTACGKLLAFFEAYGRAADDPPFTGGCPMQNTAVENDDGHPLLRDKARHSLAAWQSQLHGIVREGQASGELRQDVEPEPLVSFLMAALEGGILLSRLEADNRRMRHVTESVKAYLQAFAVRN